MANLESRLAALEQSSAGADQIFVIHPAHDRIDAQRFVLPGGIVTDSDTYTQAVERAGKRAIVIKVVYDVQKL